MYVISMIDYEKKYKDILNVRPNFDDTFNLIQEKPDAWKTFITNSQFESNLKKIFNAFSATKSNLNDRKSIWIQGTYGTGKSHSTSVIKHLLCDNYDEVSDFVKSLADISLRSMIDDFRKKHKAFPVVLRGNYTIANVTDMCYEIQKKTRESLLKAGISVCVNTDFEKAIELLDNPYMSAFWDKLLEEDLRIYCKDKEDIRKQLQNFDKEILGIIDSKYKQINDGGFGTSSITRWLKDVEHELEKQGIADHLLIIWDEFTYLLSHQESRGFLNTIQDIAEIAKEFDDNDQPERIYLVVVTHKNMEQTDAFRSRADNEQKLALARFVTCSYDMQPNTTYHILSSTFNRIDEAALKELTRERVTSDIAVSTVVDRISENTIGNISEIKEKILSLYPFHPYTAYLSTFVSRQLGDSERSVFNFLNDTEVGFKKFLENKISSIKFLPSSYIWDFFLKINNSSVSTGKLNEVINKYNMHYDVVKGKGNEYLDVFKTVLLLNALNAVVSSGEDSNERSLVTPNINNIRDCYSGLMKEEDIINILEFFDKNNIIMKSADGIFEVSTTAISSEKLNEFTKKNSELFNDITKAAEKFPVAFSQLKSSITENNGKTVRNVELIYLSSTLKNNQIEVLLNNRFNNKYSVHVCVFLSHGPCDYTKDYTPERTPEELETYIRKISGQEEYKNIIFINVETPFSELWFTRFVDSYSKYEIHQSSKPEEALCEKKRASGWLVKWVNSIINDGMVFTAFRGNTELLNFKSACNKISDDYIKFIFPFGLDTLKTAKKSHIWEIKTAKSIIQNILFGARRDDVESKLKGGIQVNIQALFKDEKNNYVFDNDFNIMTGADENHPVVLLVKKVQELLVPNPTEPIIDLHKKFEILFESPYGLYGNPISYAAMSIALRSFVDKLFIANTGIKVDKTNMVDIVEYLFKAANGGKPHSNLKVRFSSVEELKLIDELNQIFGLHESGLIRCRWEARDSFDRMAKAPIWMMKYNGSITKEVSNTIDEIFKFTIAPDEVINQTMIASLLRVIQNFRLEISTAISKAKTVDLLRKFINLTLKEMNNHNFADVSDEDYDYYTQYINAHMQDARPYWQEAQLSLQINKAFMNKNQANQSNLEDEPKTDDNVQVDDNVDSSNDNHVDINRKIVVKEKINNCSDIQKLKQIIIKILDDSDYLTDEIDDLLN